MRVARRLGVFGLASVLAVFAVGAVGLSGCGDDESASSGSTTTATASELSGTITISAAASLTEAFGDIDAAFTEANPDVTVTPTFDSSSVLAQQILAGAPSDGFASADEANMKKVTDAGAIEGTPIVFARNSLVIVTKPGNPQNITSLEDLSTAGVISLCGEDVPCGRYAKQILDEAKVVIPETSVTRGQNVKATLNAVTHGDAVAGIVYVTDAETAGAEVDTVEIPDAQNAIATYPYGVVKASSSKDLATAYGEFLVSDEGQKILGDHGFLPPA